MDPQSKSQTSEISICNETQKGDAHGLRDNEAVPPADEAIQSTKLTVQEQADFDRCCARLKQIEDLWTEFGETALEIREGSLYRDNYDTFDEFCRKELATGKSNVNRLIRCSQVAKLVATFVAIPLLEAHVRPLLKLKDPEKQVQAFQQAVADAKKKKKKKFTAVFVKRAVRAILDADMAGVPPPIKSETQKKREIIDKLEDAFIDGLENEAIQTIQLVLQRLPKWREKLLADARREVNAAATDPCNHDSQFSILP